MISKGTKRWNDLEVNQESQYSWSESSYINNPPFFESVENELPEL